MRSIAWPAPAPDLIGGRAEHNRRVASGAEQAPADPGGRTARSAVAQHRHARPAPCHRFQDVGWRRDGHPMPTRRQPERIDRRNLVPADQPARVFPSERTRPAMSRIQPNPERPESVDRRFPAERRIRARTSHLPPLLSQQVSQTGKLRLGWIGKVCMCRSISDRDPSSRTPPKPPIHRQRSHVASRTHREDLPDGPRRALMGRRRQCFGLLQYIGFPRCRLATFPGPPQGTW